MTVIDIVILLVAVVFLGSSILNLRDDPIRDSQRIASMIDCTLNITEQQALIKDGKDAVNGTISIPYTEKTANCESLRMCHLPQAGTPAYEYAVILMGTMRLTPSGKDADDTLLYVASMGQLLYTYMTNNGLCTNVASVCSGEKGDMGDRGNRGSTGGAGRPNAVVIRPIMHSPDPCEGNGGLEIHRCNVVNLDECSRAQATCFTSTAALCGCCDANSPLTEIIEMCMPAPGYSAITTHERWVMPTEAQITAGTADFRSIKFCQGTAGVLVASCSCNETASSICTTCAPSKVCYSTVTGKTFVDWMYGAMSDYHCSVMCDFATDEGPNAQGSILRIGSTPIDQWNTIYTYANSGITSVDTLSSQFLQSTSPSSGLFTISDNAPLQAWVGSQMESPLTAAMIAAHYSSSDAWNLKEQLNMFIDVPLFKQLKESWYAYTLAHTCDGDISSLWRFLEQPFMPNSLSTTTDYSRAGTVTGIFQEDSAFVWKDTRLVRPFQAVNADGMGCVDGGNRVSYRRLHNGIVVWPNFGGIPTSSRLPSTFPFAYDLGASLIKATFDISLIPMMDSNPIELMPFSWQIPMVVVEHWTYPESSADINAKLGLSAIPAMYTRSDGVLKERKYMLFHDGDASIQTDDIKAYILRHGFKTLDSGYTIDLAGNGVPQSYVQLDMSGQGCPTDTTVNFNDPSIRVESVATSGIDDEDFNGVSSGTVTINEMDQANLAGVVYFDGCKYFDRITMRYGFLLHPALHGNIYDTLIGMSAATPPLPKTCVNPPCFTLRNAALTVEVLSHE